MQQGGVSLGSARQQAAHTGPSSGRASSAPHAAQTGASSVRTTAFVAVSNAT